MSRICTAGLVLGLLCSVAAAAPAERAAAVRNGSLRWQDDGSEVRLFGVNYYTPFVIDYDAVAASGTKHEQAILDDLTHLSRLGLTAIRLHCWDRQLSDAEGNLTPNEHLRLLDFLIAEAARRGLYSVMTPIAWWGAKDSTGFSNNYTMLQMTTDAQARRAQCTYLRQYLEHVNQYTGRAYKDEPAIIALELINEPLYPPGTADAAVTAYINDLAAAVRSTGCRKPIFYNCWANRIAAAAASTLDGVTFGWYPTGLVNGSMLTGDYLARVQDYPSMRDPLLASKARIVYEFDAADVHQSVMYPAMARAFRRGGAQIATQFQYEPMCIAGSNPNWQTHYLSLPYTPGKAVSFAIAAEVMRRLESGNPAADLPGLRISYQADLSELVTDDLLLYSSDTTTVPPHPEQLARLAGVGSSPVASYGGTGAYFLDRLAPGVWKLQVYPDAVMVADPYSGGSSEKVRLLYRRWPLKLSLPDLGADYRVYACTGDTPRSQGVLTASGGTFAVTPGQYVLAAAGKGAPAQVPGVPFVAPAESPAPPAALVTAPRVWREGRPLTVRANVAAGADATCTLQFRPHGAARFTSLPMQQERPYQYSVALPTNLLQPGKADYYLSIAQGGASFALPAGAEAADAPAPPPLSLLTLRAGDAPPAASYSGPAGKSGSTRYVAGRDPGSVALQLSAEGFGEPPSCVGTSLPLTHPPTDARGYDAVSFVVRGDSLTGAVELTLVQKDGSGFGCDVPLAPVWREVTVPLSRLQPKWATKTRAPDLTQLDHLSIITGAWLLGRASSDRHQVEVQSVALTRLSPSWQMAINKRDDPVTLWAAGTQAPRLSGKGAATIVAGGDAAATAVRLSVPRFEPEPDCVSFRQSVSEEARACQEELAQARAVVLTARAGQPGTRGLELVLIEEDGTPWGTSEITLTREWQDLRIPFEKLRHFSHWRAGGAGRGGAGDHLRPDQIASLSFCFGAFTQKDNYAEPHAIELQAVKLAR